MVCEKCKKEHDGSFGSGRFCSRACANSRVKTDELRLKLSKKMRKHPKKFCAECNVLLSKSNKNDLCESCKSNKPKLCPICKTKLSESNTYFRRTENRLSAYCKQCLYFYQKERWKKRKRVAIEFLGGKCSICGYDKYFGALDFHHIDPKTKEYDWKKYRQMSLAKLKNELIKCILVCSNCHREIHGGVSGLTSNQ